MLKQEGVHTRDKVAIVLPKGENQIIAVLAILSIGATYVPIGIHAAAVNTIEDINNKNKVTCDDSVLGLSKLNFDLSVYDIFGLLQVGGKIVYPIQENYMNPDHWIKMIEEHRITIWNSVPALMKILLTELETMNTTHMLPLRCVLLSGDWIPVNMPSQIKEIVPMAKINCLGGATEASIWSINHEFCDERIYEKIPYGKPLSNQAMDVCNEDGESCPVWVQGEIIIKGKGLAKGYFNDDNLTNQKFILDKNGRLSYLTGDIGHYLPGGDIEFIGRKDNQIKIRGYRIELGEVENVLKKVENIKDAIAVVSKEKNEILAMVEPASITSEMVLEREKFCQELFDTVLSYDEHYFMEFDQEKVQLAVDSRNEAAAYSLLYGLQKMGILLKNKPILMEEILNDSVIPDKYRWLTVPWLKALLKSGLIRKRNDGKFEAIENVEWSQKEQQWNVAFDKWYDKLGNVSTLEYIKLNADEFANIMSGKTDPVTIEEIALYISAYDNQEIESPMCEKKFEYIAKNGERNGNRGRILLHGALGSVDVYRYLIPEMEKQNCGEIISIGISDLDEYCKLESEEVVLHLADLYTQKILEENLDKVQIVGYSFSGVIAIEMAKQLLEAGIDVEDVAIIDGGSIPVEIQDEIIYELFFIGNLHVSLEKLEFTDLKVFEKIFGKIVDSKQDSISISDFEDSQEDCHIYERLLELSQLTQEVRFKTYLSVSDDSSVRNFNFDMVKHLYTIFKKSFAALRFVPTVYFGDIRYFKTTERNGIFKYFEALLQEWDDVCIGDFEIIEIAGNHYSCLENPNYAHELAKKLGSVYEEWREE